MSFGKRTRPENAGRTIAPVKKVQDDDEEFEFKMPFMVTRVHILVFNVVVALLLIGFGSIIVGNLTTGGSSIKTDSTVLNSMRGGHPVIFAIPEGSEKLSWIDRNINEQCFDAQMMARQRKALDRRGSQSSIVIHVPRHAVSNYLVCTMGVEKQRFCQSHYRERLISRIKVLIRNRKMLKAQDRMMTSTPMMRRHMSSSRRASGMMAGRQITSNSPMNGPLIEPHLGAELRQLAQEGYLSSSDFGWFTAPPKEIAKYIVDALGESPCR